MLNEILDFKVLKMTDIINQVNFNPERIPDHSILLCEIKENRHMPTGRCFQPVLRFQCGKWFR
jgi:hypothetical protein